MKKILSIIFLLFVYVCSYAQPANDEPCGAITLTPTIATSLPSTCTPTTTLTWVGATTSATTPLPSCGWDGINKDVWYSFTTNSGVDSIVVNTASGTTSNATSDAVMVLYKAISCNSTFIQIGCNDDANGTNMPFLKLAVTENSKYYLRIYDFGADRNFGEMKICIALKYNIPSPDPAKNVGIGIAYPENNLDVNGTAKVRTDLTIDNITKTKYIVVTNNVKIESGNPAIGKVLTSDAAGNATWQENSSNGGVGFGAWGDCSMNNVSEYNPIVDDSAKLENRFGTSVSILGNFAVIGSPNDKIGSNTQQGSASIYQLINGEWVFKQKIIDGSGAPYDNFGTSVSISPTHIVIGAANDDVGTNIDQGSVIIFQMSAGIWVQMQKIIESTGAYTADRFGKSVSISGNFIIVGTPQSDIGANIDQGSASIYQLSSGVWIFLQKLTDLSGAAGDVFGSSVSLFGNYAVVGIPNDEVGTNAGQGSVNIYQLISGSWVFTQNLTDVFGAPNDAYGFSLSVSNNFLVVGTPYNDEGSNSNQGLAVIYQLKNGTWSVMQRIIDETNNSSNYFGCSVSISGNYIIVGSYGNDIGTNQDQGSAYIYQRIGLSWQKYQYLKDPGGLGNDYFGRSVGIDGSNKRFIIGVPNYSGYSGKVIFGKLNL
jgi:hypothetical protein